MKLLKPLVAFLFVNLLLLPLLPAQRIVSFQYRHVPPENVEEFLHRETNYWAEVASAAIKADKLEYWALYEKVGGWNLKDGSSFIFINIFKDPAAVDNMAGVWDASKVFPKVRPGDIETNSLSTVRHQLIFQEVARAGEGVAQFMRINYAKASDMDKYLELEQSTWQPYIKGQMESKNTNQVFWRLAQLIHPAGTSLPFNAITVDGYSKMSEALVPASSYKSAPQVPNLDALMDVHEKDRIQVYGLVKRVAE